MKWLLLCTLQESFPSRNAVCSICKKRYHYPSILSLSSEWYPEVSRKTKQFHHVESHQLHDAETASSLPLFLALEDRQIPIICVWLDIQSLGLLDVAVSSSRARELWLMILESITCESIDMWDHCYSSMMWAILRRIRVTHIQLNSKHRDRICETWQPFYF